jgi:hypothetical protein
MSAEQTLGISYGELKLDPERDRLRGDPRFEKLVASLKAEVAGAWNTGTGHNDSLMICSISRAWEELIALPMFRTSSTGRAPASLRRRNV